MKVVRGRALVHLGFGSVRPLDLELQAAQLGLVRPLRLLPHLVRLVACRLRSRHVPRHRRHLASRRSSLAPRRTIERRLQLRRVRLRRAQRRRLPRTLLGQLLRVRLGLHHLRRRCRQRRRFALQLRRVRHRRHRRHRPLQLHRMCILGCHAVALHGGRRCAVLSRRRDPRTLDHSETVVHSELARRGNVRLVDGGSGGGGGAGGGGGGGGDFLASSGNLAGDLGASSGNLAALEIALLCLVGGP